MREIDKRTEQLVEKYCEILCLILSQANDEGLWFVTKTASEAYLQQELRKLHSKIEEGLSFLGDEK